MLYSLTQINESSPYVVSESGENTAYFVTDSGIEYLVGFIEDTNMGIPNTYQLFITRKNKNKTIGVDVKIAETISAIVNSFFRNNKNILVYICDTSDKHEAARHRKFKAWCQRYADENILSMNTESIEVEDNTYYASMILARELKEASEIQDLFHNYFQYLRSKLD